MIQPIYFAIGNKESSILKNNREHLVNLYAENSSDSSESSLILLNAPAEKEFVTLPTNNVLGIATIEDKLHVVTSTKWYIINSLGSITEVGDVDLSKRAYFSYNGIEVIVTADKTYKYDFSTVSEITDPACYESNANTFLDGYFIFNRNGTNQFFISNLYSTTFTGTDYASAEANPDNIVRVISDGKKIWLFGEKTIEIWYNSGDVDFPFQRISGAVVQRGTLDYRSIAVVNDTVVWVGDDSIVYLADGFTPRRISNTSIESEFKDVKQAIAFSFTENGHHFYCVYNPVSDRTLVFDFATGLWHTRQTEDNHWKITNIAELNGVNYGISDNSNVIYTISGENTLKNKKEAITAPIHNNGNWFTVNKVVLEIETGVGDDDTIYLQYSNDGGYTWSNVKEQTFGSRGNRYKQVIFNRLGRHRQLMLKVFTYSENPVRFIKAYGDITG